MNTKTKQVTFIAMAVAINFVGAKLSIFLNLPIFLDTIGTIFAGATMGPVGGMIAGIVSGCLNGVTGDVYALYFSASGVLIGLLAGVILHNKPHSVKQALWLTPIISVPASAVSAFIETVLFGGVTSAVWTTAAIQIMSRTVASLFGSAFLVQAITDYADKLIGVALVITTINRLPYSVTHFEKREVKKKNTEKTDN